MKACHSILLMFAVLVSVRPVCSEEPDSQLDRKISKVLQAETELQLRRAYQDLFEGTTSNDLAKLVANESFNICIPAAWERVRRTVPEGHHNKNVSPDSAEIARFLGVVEGYTHVPLPRTWERTVRSAGSWARSNIFFDTSADVNPVMRPFVIDINETASGKVKQEGNRCNLIMHDKILSFPVDGKKYLYENASILFDESSAFVALYEWPPAQFQLLAVDRGDGTVKWSSIVWGTGFQVDMKDQVGTTSIWPFANISSLSSDYRGTACT